MSTYDQQHDVNREPVGAPGSVGGQSAGRNYADASDTDLATPDTMLYELLAPYGITADDVPPAADGTTITQAWADLRRRVDADAPSTTQALATSQIGEVNYGRYRSGPDVALIRDDGWNPIGNAIELGLDRAAFLAHWADPGYRLVALVSTRNGGGNRECWCDNPDKHDEGCLASVNEALKAHPRYVMDADEEDDPTYATFAFRLDLDDAMRNAIETDADQRSDQYRFDSLRYKRIRSSDAPVWDCLPVNARTKAEMREEDRLTEERRKGSLPNSMATAFVNRYRNNIFTPVTPDHLADLTDVLDAIENNAPAPVLRAQWERASRMDDGLPWLSKREDAHRKMEAITVAIQQAQSGEIGEAAAQIVLDATSSILSDWSQEKAESRANEADERVVSFRTDLADAQAAMAESLGKEAEAEAHRRRSQQLLKALHWPGGPDTMPRRLEPAPGTCPPC